MNGIENPRLPGYLAGEVNGRKEYFMQHTLTAAVIAGGKSTRFGRNKLRETLAGKEIIDYAIQLGQQIARECIIIHGDDDDFSDKGLSHYSDVVSSCGPAGGVYTALFYAAQPWVATIPGDVPLLQPAIYEYLYENRQKNTPVVAVSHKGMEPLVAIWPRALVTNLEHFVHQRKLALHEILEALQALTIPIPDLMADYSPQLFLNVNTQEDFEQLKSILLKKS